MWIQSIVQYFKLLKLANTGINSEPIRFANLVIIVVRPTNSILKPLRLLDAMFPPGLSALHRLSWLHKLNLRSCTDTEGALTDCQLKDLCNIKGLSSFVLVNCKLSDSVCSHSSLLCSLQHLEIQQHCELTYRLFHHIGRVTTVQSLRINIEGSSKM